MTIQANEISILNQILLVDLSGIHLWTARRKLKREMLEGTIPPSRLASLGSMRVIDPERLKPFEKIKRQAIKVLETHGIKFLGGYAIPQEKIQGVVDELDALKTAFYDLKSNFMPNYDRWVNEWVEQEWERDEWREAIMQSTTPKHQVEAGLQFGYAACRVAPDGDKHLSATLGSQVRGLSDQLYAETAETAEKLLDSGLATRGHVTQTTLNTIRKMNAKLKGLMFLSADIEALSAYIDEALAALPASGVVNGTQYNGIVTLVSALSHEDSIRRLIKNLNTANGSVPEVVVEQPAQPEAEITSVIEPKAEAHDEKISEKEPEKEEIVEAVQAEPINPFVNGFIDEVFADELVEDAASAEPEPVIIPTQPPVSSLVVNGVFNF